MAESIRARGFRRWYERQLYEGHAYLVTGLLSLIMMALSLELIEFRRSVGSFVALIAVSGAGGALCIFAWRRFTFTLFRAEYMAERATCAACSVYGRFDILSAREVPGSVTGCSLDVSCRKCRHRWTID